MFWCCCRDVYRDSGWFGFMFICISISLFVIWENIVVWNVLVILVRVVVVGWESIFKYRVDLNGVGWICVLRDIFFELKVSC